MAPSKKVSYYLGFFDNNSNLLSGSIFICEDILGGAPWDSLNIIEEISGGVAVGSTLEVDCTKITSIIYTVSITVPTTKENSLNLYIFYEDSLGDINFMTSPVSVPILHNKIQIQINRLTAAKTAISTAITNKGVTVPSDMKLDGMAALIDSIESGGSGGTQLETATLTIKTTYSKTYEGFYQIVATRYVNGTIEPYIFFRDPSLDNDPIRETVIDNVLLNSPIYCFTLASSGIQSLSTNGIGDAKMSAGFFTGKIIASEASITHFDNE